jgi:hypothetical protein
MTTDEIADLARAFRERVAAPVSRFRRLQDVTGAVVHSRGEGEEILRQVVKETAALCAVLGTEAFSEAFAEDAAAWIAGGLHRAPGFSRTRDAYRTPADGEVTLFVGPTLAQNGPPPRGLFLEAFCALREEPEALKRMAEEVPHPLNPCQSTRLLAASDGFATGNSIVFFPEYVGSSDKVERQTYAVFFFNKFFRMYNVHTLPTVRATLGEQDSFFGGGSWISGIQDARFVYSLRCVWGYLHDFFHHSGERPLHTNLQLKQGWCPSVLEELRADCRTALFAFDRRFQGWGELLQFVLFERMFRYPLQGDRDVNFDSATGFFLFEHLRRHGALTWSAPALSLDLEKTIEGLRAFVEGVEELERISDDDRFREAAESFVRAVLPAPGPGVDGCRPPVAYDASVASRFAGDFVRMTDLTY